MKEEWKIYKGLEVSSLGRIRKNGKISKGHEDSAGYRHFSIGEKKMQIGRLVLLAFVGECPVGHECDHINNKRGDNRLSNLQWLAVKENRKKQVKRYHYRKYTVEMVRMMRSARERGEKYKDIAKEFGCSELYCSKLIRGK